MTIKNPEKGEACKCDWCGGDLVYNGEAWIHQVGPRLHQAEPITEEDMRAADREEAERLNAARLAQREKDHDE